MSRTYRKNRINETLDVYLKHSMAYHYARGNRIFTKNGVLRVDHTEEELNRFRQEHIDYYTKGTRDGRYSEFSRTKGARHEANRMTRLKNRKVCRDILSGKVLPDDDYELPVKKDGKMCIWECWWW